jgi:hypothetical protein
MAMKNYSPAKTSLWADRVVVVSRVPHSLRVSKFVTTGVSGDHFQV